MKSRRGRTARTSALRHGGQNLLSTFRRVLTRDLGLTTTCLPSSTHPWFCNHPKGRHKTRPDPYTIAIMHQFLVSLLVNLQTDLNTIDLVADNARSHAKKTQHRRRTLGRAESAPDLINSKRSTTKSLRGSRRFSETCTNSKIPPSLPRRGVQRSSSFDGEFAQQPRSSLRNVSRPKRRTSIGEGSSTLTLPSLDKQDSVQKFNASKPLRKEPLSLNDMKTSLVTCLPRRMRGYPELDHPSETDRKARAEFLAATLNDTLKQIVLLDGTSIQC